VNEQLPGCPFEFFRSPIQELKAVPCQSVSNITGVTRAFSHGRRLRFRFRRLQSSPGCGEQEGRTDRWRIVLAGARTFYQNTIRLRSNTGKKDRVARGAGG
jgi:hypothetical protein